jgi:formate/nitrite transporter FocA (FNT family)
VWFPISTFVAIGLEHSVANLFIMPAALLLKVPLSIGDVLFRNVIPVLIGNFIAGAFLVAGSYSYQFGQLGKKQRANFRARFKARKKKQQEENVLQ